MIGLDVFDDAGGHSRHYGEGRNGGSDHGSGCHHGMPSDGDSRQNDRMRSYPHVIVDGHLTGGHSLAVDELVGVIVNVIEGGDNHSLCQMHMMADIMEVNPDNSPVSIPLEELFHMD